MRGWTPETKPSKGRNLLWQREPKVQPKEIEASGEAVGTDKGAHKSVDRLAFTALHCTQHNTFTRQLLGMLRTEVFICSLAWPGQPGRGRGHPRVGP
jgi:hypothetical protein